MRTLQLAFLMLLLVSVSGEAQDSLSPKEDLANLETFYQVKLSEVHSPVIERYLASLEALEATYLNVAKLDEAKQVRKEIDWVKSKGWLKGKGNGNRAGTPASTPSPFKPAPSFNSNNKQNTEPPATTPKIRPPAPPPVTPSPPTPPITPPPTAPPTVPPAGNE